MLSAGKVVAALTAGAVLSGLTPVVSAGRCWTNMDSSTGLCDGAPHDYFPENANECFNIRVFDPNGGPDIYIDFPFFGNSDRTNCIMTGAEPLGDCCRDSACTDCSRRWNRDDCPAGFTAYFSDYYLNRDGSSCAAISSGKSAFQPAGTQFCGHLESLLTLFFLKLQVFKMIHTLR